MSEATQTYITIGSENQETEFWTWRIVIYAVLDYGNHDKRSIG